MFSNEGPCIANYDLNNDGKCNIQYNSEGCECEPFVDIGNGKWDWDDKNNNNKCDKGECEDFTDAFNGKWDEGEEFVDVQNGICDFDFKNKNILRNMKI